MNNQGCDASGTSDAREVASVNERLLDFTADLHRLHLIRESPEHELYRLRSEIAVFQRRLAHVEGADAPQ